VENSESILRQARLVETIKEGDHADYGT
jgi:hypothetical protein